MEENIFDNARFGDKFLTRDGKIAIYVSKDEVYSEENNYTETIEHSYVVQNRDSLYRCDDNGKNIFYNNPNLDIISKYEDHRDDVHSFCDWVFLKYNADIPIYEILDNFLEETKD